MNTKSDRFKRPSVAVDVLIFTVSGKKLKIILVKRGVDPFRGIWALPGGFVGIDESLETAAKRELMQETGVQDIYLEQLYTFGDPDRDPRERVITAAYFALIPSERIKLHATTDVTDAAWFSVDDLPKLAFDHKKIINLGIERLKSKIGYSNIVYGLLPNKFRLSELQGVYEVILGQVLDKRNFRKRMLSLGLLKTTGEKEIEGAHRPAMLYQFKRKEVVLFDFMIS